MRVVAEMRGGDSKVKRRGEERAAAGGHRLPRARRQSSIHITPRYYSLDCILIVTLALPSPLSFQPRTHAASSPQPLKLSPPRPHLAPARSPAVAPPRPAPLHSLRSLSHSSLRVYSLSRLTAPSVLPNRRADIKRSDLAGTRCSPRSLAPSCLPSTSLSPPTPRTSLAVASIPTQRRSNVKNPASEARQRVVAAFATPASLDSLLQVPVALYLRSRLPRTSKV